MRLPQRVLCVLGAGLVASLAFGAESADAQYYGSGYYRPYRPHKVRRARHNEERTSEKREKEKHGPPQAAHLVVVSIGKQRISAYGAGGFHAQGAVSTGMPGFPTPTGVFSVIQKSRYHRSNIYSGAPMPYMQRVTWSGVAMHEGVLPGRPASHGCIRLTHAFASELWGMTRMNVRVIVTPDDAQPTAFAHPNLPVPTMTPAPATAAENDAARPVLITVATNDKAPDGAEVTTPPPVKLLSPLDRAKAEKTQITVDAPAKAKAAKEAAEVSAAKAVEANKAIIAVREAESAAAAARSRQEAAAKAVEAAKTPEAVEKAKGEQSAAEAKVEEAVKAINEAAALEVVKTQEAFAAAQAAWDAEKDSDVAAAVVRAGDRVTEPISVFMSKKTGRVYIRKAWKPIYEAAATFKDPGTPLGTHVYVATEQQADGKGMRWLSITLPQAAAEGESRQRGRRGERRPEPAPTAHPGHSRETAAGALGRVELSEETKKFIADRLWAGASLIISDNAASDETDKDTDFIVKLR